MTKPLHHLQFNQLAPNYEAVIAREYHHLIILGTGEKAKEYHGQRMVLGEDDEKRKLLEPFIVRSPEELLNIAGEGTAYDVYKSLCTPFGNLEVSILLIDYDYLEEAFSLLENIDFSFLVFDPEMRIEQDMSFVIETDFLDDPDVIVAGLERRSLFHRYIEVAGKALARGRIIHAFSLCRTEDISVEDIHKRLLNLREFVDNEFIDNGKFFTLVEDQLQTEFAHAYYASLALTQDVHESPTNKAIGNPVLRRSLEDYEHVYYERYGIVTMIDSYHRGVVFSNCSTAITTEDELHKHFPHQKIAQYSIRILGDSMDIVIGQPINAKTKNRVEQILQSVRTFLISKKKYLRDMGYQYEFKPVKGEMHLLIILVPTSSIQAMTIETQVKVVVN